MFISHYFLPLQKPFVIIIIIIISAQPTTFDSNFGVYSPRRKSMVAALRHIKCSTFLVEILMMLPSSGPAFSILSHLHTGRSSVFSARISCIMHDILYMFCSVFKVFWVMVCVESNYYDRGNNISRRCLICHSHVRLSPHGDNIHSTRSCKVDEAACSARINRMKICISFETACIFSELWIPGCVSA